MDMQEQQIRGFIREELANALTFGLFNATPPHTHNGIDAQQLDPRFFLSYPALIAPNVVVASTNGTSAVNVFGAGGAPLGLTVKSVISIAKDTTAGNITLKQDVNTVCTIAKGTVAGVLVGAATLANTAYKAKDAFTVVSSTAGNSFVIIIYTAN